MSRNQSNAEIPNGNQNLEQLEAALGYVFKDISLLKLAVTHESYANEQDPEIGNNERLEFLGDSVLGCVVCHYLYNKHKTDNEGVLAKIKAYVASTNYLAEMSKRIRLGDYLMLGRGENQSMGRNRSNVLADTFEAVVGALYLDGGIEPARKFILGLLQEAIDSKEGANRDYKSILQEYTQHYFRVLPTYKTNHETGPAHDRTYYLSVNLDERLYGCGEGHTKQEAGQQAAKEALALIWAKSGFDCDEHYEIPAPQVSVEVPRAAVSESDSDKADADHSCDLRSGDGECLGSDDRSSSPMLLAKAALPQLGAEVSLESAVAEVCEQRLIPSDESALEMPLMSSLKLANPELET